MRSPSGKRSKSTSKVGHHPSTPPHWPLPRLLTPVIFSFFKCYFMQLTAHRHPTGRSRGCTPPPLSSLIPIRHFCKKPTVVAASLPFFEGCKRTADPSERSQTMSTRRWVWSRCACIRFFLWESFDKASPAFGSFSAECWGEMARGLDRTW